MTMHFTATPNIVWLYIHDRDAKFPRISAESIAFMHKLRAWMEANTITPVYLGGGQSGGGSLSHAFWDYDAKKIIRWLKANGAVEAK